MWRWRKLIAGLILALARFSPCSGQSGSPVVVPDHGLGRTARCQSFLNQAVIRSGRVRDANFCGAGVALHNNPDRDSGGGEPQAPIHQQAPLNMSNDETKLHEEDGAVAEAGACRIEASLDAQGVGIRIAHATLSYVSLTAIEPNPFRDLKTHPFDKRKLEALECSIEHVGLWEGLIGRRAGQGYQLAFGHHRLEAARNRKLTTVPLIIRDLTDEEMVGFMGRENMEDFNSDFLVMLASWEAAQKFLISTEIKTAQPLEVARLLGWTRVVGKQDNLNNLASACNAAATLINAGHFTRDDLSGMSVSAAREIVERAQSRMEMLDQLGKMGNRPAAEIARDKKLVGSAARTVAKDVREGSINHRNIRSAIDYRAVKSSTAKGKASPLFAAFSKEVADSIHKMLVSDNTSVRLSEMEKALPHVTMDEDHATLQRMDSALAEHGETTAKWRSRLLPKKRPVVPFELVKKADGSLR
jgi:ParB-like chromosome segregation protein Spo0J